jgi:hypothetical protein
MYGQFRVMQIVWMIMGFSQLILLVPALIVLRKDLPQQDVGGPVLLIFVIGLLLLAAVFPVWWYRRRLPQGAAIPDPEKKLEHYRAPVLLGWVLAEVGNVLALIAYLLNRDPVFLGLFALGFAVFYVRQASFERFIKDYRLKP